MASVRAGVSVAALLLAAVFAGHARAGEDVTVRARGGAVVISGHPEATRVGLEVMRGGGNAVDAAVAVGLALGVAEPMNSGLGGKMTMLYYEAATGKVTHVVGFAAAPMKIDVEKVIAADERSKSRGWTSACVPGHVAGLGAAHAKWGTKPWSELVTPAAELAEKGFELSPRGAEMWSEFRIGEDVAATALYAPGGKHPAAGRRMNNPDLAKVLREIAAGGWKAFYTGSAARGIVASANKAGWPISMEELAAYKASVVEPLAFDYRGYRVFTAGAPLSGGATVRGVLQVLEAKGWPEGFTTTRDARGMDAVGRAMLQVNTAVGRAAGDTPDSDKRIEAALSPEKVREMAEKARTLVLKPVEKDVAPRSGPADPGGEDARAPRTAAEALAMGLTGDDSAEGCTTHFMVVDTAGNVVCMTQSLGLHFGAGVVAEGTGILMNSDMSNFAYRTPGSVNQIAPGKRPRSTMSPTIVTKDGKPVVVIGSPGGQRIPVVVSQVLLEVLDLGRDPLEAVRAPRWHLRRGTSAADNNIVDCEAGSAPELIEALRKAGWRATPRTDAGFYFGSVQVAVWGRDGTIRAVADRRRTSDAGGIQATD